MGVDLKDLIPEDAKTSITDLRSLRGRVIAIDAYNALYQFLTAIRQPDGTPLMDNQGRVTSHLSGLFYRTINLVENGIKPIYVFDGKPPELKAREIEKRRTTREEAIRKYEEAVKTGDLETARKYAVIASKLTDYIVEESKRLLVAMGIPLIQAPGEGEAQAAFIARQGDAYASASQDYDSLLFGSPRLIRNLTISGKRKLPRREEYIEVFPELIELDKLLSKLNMSREALVDIGILLGTDYNPEGFEGIGPRKALQLIKTYGSIEKIPKALLRSPIDIDISSVKRLFIDPPVTRDYKIEWREPDVYSITEILVKEHDFSEERVKNALERFIKAYREHLKGTQEGLSKWFTKKTKS